MAVDTDDEAGNNAPNEEDTIHTFIRKNIKQSMCSKYLPKGTGEDCYCGRDLRWHRENGVPSGQAGQKWNIDECTKESPCTSYGEIRMLGFSKNRMMGKPKYIRVAGRDLDMKLLWELMIKYWKMPEPDLILSANGGTKNMEKLTPRLTAAIRQGLFKVSSSLNTWIITGGVGVGVSQLIGQAAHELPLQAQAEERVLTVVGICAWGTIHNHEALENVGVQQTRTYVNSRFDPGHGKVVLDPNHTHFILVDDGRVGYYNSEIGFRFDFERSMAEEVAKKGEGGPAPIVQLLIEGGKRALEMVESALNEEMPVVVIKGSMRCADLICRCVERTCDSDEPVESIVKEELELFRESWKLTTEKSFNRCAGILVNICTENKKRVSIFDVDSPDDELDKVILSAILQNNDLPLRSQLLLTMSMNRWDLAKENVFCPSKRKEIPDLHLDDRMMTALINNQTEFVDLFLEEGVVIQHFLTAERLSDLYNQTIYSKPKDSMKSSDAFLKRVLSSIKIPLWKMCCRGKFSSSVEVMCQVSYLIDHLTDQMVPSFYEAHDFIGEEDRDKREVNGEGLAISTYSRDGDNVKFLPNSKTQRDKYPKGDMESLRKHKSTKDSQDIHYPVFPPRNEEGHRIFTEQDLFLWAILLKRMALAKLFWRMGKEHVSSALIASAIMSRLGHRAITEGEVSLAQEFEMNSKEFEALAVEILSMAYSCTKFRTHILLCRSLAMWKSHTCMTLASQFSSMEFLHNTACQTRLNRIWMGAMPSSTPVWKIVLNIFLSLIFIRLIFPADTIDEKETIKASKADKDAEQAKESDPAARTNMLYEPPMVRNARSSAGFKKITTGNVNMHANFKRLSYCKALNEFYCAPVTKFVLNVLLYIAFLGVLTYFVLVDLRPVEVIGEIKFLEIIVWIWCGTIIFQELRQIVREEQHSLMAKISDWFSNPWNKFDFGVILCFLLSIGLRVVLPKEDFMGVRIVYAIMLTLFYIRFMQFYFAHRFIGPKVVMVSKMMYDVFFFLCIYGVFLLAYGTLAHALMYPDSEPQWIIVKRIFYYPYWQTYGELNLEHVEGNHNCTADDKDCNRHSPIVVVAFAIFMLATNVLLLNLLIAMFGNTFASVQSTSERVWAYHRYSLIQEFVQRPTAPPPFSIFAIIYRGIWSLISRVCSNNKGKKLDTPFKFHLNVEDDSRISQFEQHCMELYCSTLQTDDKVDYFRETAEKFESLMESIGSLRETRISNRLTFQEPSTISRGGGRLDDIDSNRYNPLSPRGQQRSDTAKRLSEVESRETHERLANLEYQIGNLTVMLERVLGKEQRVLSL